MGVVIKRNGNIFASKAECLVCPTNAVGVMGNGLALAFRNRYQGLFNGFRNHCRKHQPNDLVPFIFDDRNLPHAVYCFPTKRDWREDSKLSIIESGLRKLKEWCDGYQLRSIAIPALGSGKGNLEWEDVMPLILAFAEAVPDIEVEIYIPYGH